MGRGVGDVIMLHLEGDWQMQACKTSTCGCWLCCCSCPTSSCSSAAFLRHLLASFSAVLRFLRSVWASSFFRSGIWCPFLRQRERFSIASRYRVGARLHIAVVTALPYAQAYVLTNDVSRHEGKQLT